MKTETKRAVTKRVEVVAAPRLRQDQIVESVQSILAMLRGIGPLLISSSPHPEEVRMLLEQLKEPHA